MPAGYFVSLSALDYQQEKDTKTGSQVRTGLTACPRAQPYKPHENTTVQTTRRFADCGSKVAEILVCFTNPLTESETNLVKGYQLQAKFTEKRKCVFHLRQVF